MDGAGKPRSKRRGGGGAAAARRRRNISPRTQLYPARLDLDSAWLLLPMRIRIYRKVLF
eukprot:SAG31_NODE_918_length_11020_cov_14.801392_4_plen_59_part_00